jgi:hypothetical protein
MPAISASVPFSSGVVGPDLGWERGQLARGAATRAGRPRSQARGVPQV